MKVSVAMCTYNGEKYVREQLESILNQTRIPDEIIIYDDRSSDSTVDIVRNILESCTLENMEYCVVVNEKNLGFVKNFQKCAQRCTGDIVFFADQDDVWLESKVSVMLEEFERNPKCVLCYSDAIVTDSELNEIQKSMYNADLPVTAEELLSKAFRMKGNIFGCTIAVRNEILRQIMPFMFQHDYDLSISAPLFGDIAAIMKPLIYYRRHSHAFSIEHTHFEKRRIKRKYKNIVRFLKTVRDPDKEKWFGWPSANLRSWGGYEKKYGERLRQVESGIFEELKERVAFLQAEEEIICSDRVRAIKVLIGEFRNGRYAMRGNRRAMILDVIYILIHGNS